MEPYRYEAIPDSETTRILTLDAGEPSAPLRGSLSLMRVRTASVTDHDEAPFEALSYVWGASAKDEAIRCDGKALEITSSLAAALARIRLPDRPRRLWADQICINQADLVERSQQVRHMSPIYASTSTVLVWLGEDSDGLAERAFSLLRSLSAVGRDPLLLGSFRERDQVYWYPAEHWTSLARLFRQEWFDRKWILQEIGTEAPAQLHWGQHSIFWDHVSKAAVLLQDHGYALRREHDVLVWKPAYMDRLFAASSYRDRPLSFVYELHRARWQRASDPRDHVFALLGHPSARQGPEAAAVMEADYTKLTAAVYHELAVRMLRGTGSLMILNVVQHESARSVQQANLPTWVPRWDSQAGLHNLLGDVYCVYRPSRDVRPAPRFSDADRLLTLDGAVVDTLSNTSQILETADLQLGSATVAALWREQPECILAGEEEDRLSTRPRYGPGRGKEAALYALLETLSAVKKRARDAPVPLAERLADGAGFLVEAYGATHHIAADVRHASMAGDCYRWMERASGGANRRRFGRGEAGYYALCPPAAEPGDKLCLLLGGQTLFCLRPRGDEYLFVGECYVHGVMNGEVLDRMERGDVARTSFSIR